MSDEDFAQLQATGDVPATGETFISPSAEYAAGYSGRLVQFTVQPGTSEALAGIGVRDASALTAEAYPDMPLVSSGWTATSAFFKAEGGIINVGLGRGAALNLFNNAIQSFGEVPG